MPRARLRIQTRAGSASLVETLALRGRLWTNEVKAGAGAPAGRGRQHISEELNMDLEAIERRLTRLEDIEAIKQLKARYCEICDDDHNPERITSVFAEDGIWESAEFGTGKGHAEIRKLFQGFQKLIEFSQHNIMNPIIEVHNDRATGEWYFMGPFKFRAGQQARWLALQYKDDYVKLNGQWKYKHLRVNLRLSAPYEEGWAKQLIAPLK
jgi:hypothetical protein